MLLSLGYELFPHVRINDASVEGGERLTTRKKERAMRTASCLENGSNVLWPPSDGETVERDGGGAECGC